MRTEIAAIRKMKGGDIEWTTGCLSSSLSILPDLGFVHPLHNSVAAQSNLLLSINILLKHHKKKRGGRLCRGAGRVGGQGNESLHKVSGYSYVFVNGTPHNWPVNTRQG